jgi:hypothetical protein
LLVVCLGGTHAAAHNQATDPQPYAYLLAGFAALTLLLRRRAPLVGMSAAALATAAYLLLDQPYGPILFAAPAWAWCLTAVLPLRRAVPWLAGYLALVVVAAAPGHVQRNGWGGCWCGPRRWSSPSPPEQRSASRWPPGRARGGGAGRDRPAAR